MIGTSEVAAVLVEQARSCDSDWLLATLGRLPANVARPAAERSGLLPRIAPMLLLGEGANWLASEERLVDIVFLLKQNL